MAPTRNNGGKIASESSRSNESLLEATDGEWTHSPVNGHQVAGLLQRGANRGHRHDDSRVGQAR